MRKDITLKFSLISFLLMVFLLFFLYLVNAQIPDIDITAFNEVVINEIEANPEGSPDIDEWIEVYNLDPLSPVNLSSWHLQDRDGNNFSFPAEIITDFFVLEMPTNALVNNNETVRLYDNFDVIRDEFGPFNDNNNDNNTWSRVPDGTGNFTFKNSTKGFSNIETMIENKSVDSECVLKTDNVTLNVQVTGYCIEDVIFSVLINGTWNNFTGINVGEGNDYSYILDPSLFSGSEFINWTVYAIDCFNLTSQNGIESFYVSVRTDLDVIPDEPDGLNDWYITEPIFILENLDASELFYQWDSDDVFEYTEPFDLDNIPNAPPRESAGILELNYFSDFCNFLEEIQTEILYIDLTDPIINNLVPKNNSIIFNNRRPEISAFLDEVYHSNSGIDTEIVQMSLNGIDYSPEIDVNHTGINQTGIDAILEFIPTFDLPLGQNNVTVNISDNAGRNSELSWFFFVNETPEFTMRIYAPGDAHYGKRIVPFNITTSKEVEEIEYINYNDRKPRWNSLCMNCDEYGFLKMRTKTLLEGENNISIKATDEFGIVVEENISFFIDSKEPRIFRTEPRRNSVVNGSEFLVKYTEDSLESVKLFWNPNLTLSNCTSGNNQECKTEVNLSDFDGQFIIYYFEVSDTINSVKSKEVEVFVDTTSPDLNVIAPENDTTYESNVPFNITISEEVTLEYIDETDSRPRWRRLCSRCDEYGNSRVREKRFSGEGIHSILIKATDEAGNSDVESIGFVVV